MALPFCLVFLFLSWSGLRCVFLWCTWLTILLLCVCSSLQLKKWDGPAQFVDSETQTMMMLPTDMALICDPAFRA